MSLELGTLALGTTKSTQSQASSDCKPSSQLQGQQEAGKSQPWKDSIASLPPLSGSLVSAEAGQPAASPFICLWAVEPGKPCMLNFADPDVFYAHLAEEHVGRKSHGNLTLHCAWMGCGHGDRAFTKRDHIVSHCRAHVPFKANVCGDCKAQFKWPQDLKKHCLKQGHAFIEPSARAERPGPSTVVVDHDTGASMVREGPRLTGGTRKPGRGRGISLVPRASNAQQQQQQQQLIQQLQRQLNQQQSPQRQNHEEATISDPTISVDQSNESILAALLSLGKPQQTFKIQYQQSQHYQPQHSQSNSNTQQQLHFNQSQAGYSNQTLESDQKRAQEQHILKQQYDLNQQRQMQQLQKSIPNQQSQHQQQELGLPPQSPSFQTSTTTPINPSGGNQQANSVQALLNTPIPQATKGPISASPAFFNMNPHSQAKFKKPAPPGTPLHVHSMNASIMSNSLNNTSSSKPKRNGPIHSLLMQSPSFNHPSTGSSALLGGKSPMIGHTLNNRMHPYPQLQQRLNNNQNSNHSDKNNFSVNNVFSNNALLGMPSPVPAYPAMTPAFHNQGQMQDFFAIGGLVGNGAASPFIRHQNDTLLSMNQHQQQLLQDGQLMQQGFLGSGGATQFLMGGGSQLFADASVLNSPAFGPISGAGFGMGSGDDDISAMNGLLFGNGMNSGASLESSFGSDTQEANFGYSTDALF